MKIDSQFRAIFRKSKHIGVLYELVSYVCLLLCGYLLSGLLEDAIAGQWQQIGRGSGLTVLVLLLTGAVKYVLTVWRSEAKLADTQRFRLFLYQHVLDRTLPIQDAGEMNVRMTGDVQTLSTYFQDTQPKGLSALLIMTCSTVLLCLLHLPVGLIFFFCNLTQLLPIFLYEGWARQIYNQTHCDEETYCNWMLEGYHGIRTLKAYHMEAWYMKRYTQYNRSIVRSGKRSEQVSTIENIVFQAIDSLLNYGSYLILGIFILTGSLRLEQTPLLIVLAGHLFSSISSVFQLRLQQFRSEEAYARLRCHPECATEVSADSILHMEHITKSYGEKRVLRDASLTIREGDHMLLQGANGSGKTTLLRIMTGLENADSGEVSPGISKELMAISLQEEPVLNISGSELVTAMQHSPCIVYDALLRHLTNFKIKDCLARPLSELSPGERKKFFLSVALAHRGKLLILDEPTNHLDQHSIRYFLDELRTYRGTWIVCTHHAEGELEWNRRICVEGGLCHEA